MHSRPPPPILNIGTRWSWEVNFTPRPLYPRERTPISIEQEDEWVSSFSNLRRITSLGKNFPTKFNTLNRNSKAQYWRSVQSVVGVEKRLHPCSWGRLVATRSEAGSEGTRRRPEEDEREQRKRNGMQENTKQNVFRRHENMSIWHWNCNLRRIVSLIRQEFKFYI
jgi:hypothetical protein